MSFRVPEKARVIKGRLASTEEDGNNGAFAFSVGPLTVIALACDSAGWERVKIIIRSRGKTPSWQVMAQIKNYFWDAEDTVPQYHLAESVAAKMSRKVLMLMRPTDGVGMPVPPTEMLIAESPIEDEESRLIMPPERLQQLLILPGGEQ